MKNNIKLIALDLDDTLLTTDKFVTSYTRNVLKICLDRGIRIVTVSGRYFASQYSLIHNIELNLEREPQISNGGGVIFRGKTILKKLGSMPDEVYQKTRQLLENSGVLYYVDDGKDVYYNAKNHPEMAYPYGKKKKAGYLKAHYHKDLSKLSGVLRLVVYCKNRQQMQSIQQILFPAEIALYRGGRTVIEITSKKLNKLTALKQLCNKEKIDLNEAAAIGDSENDLSMITGVGLGMAVANSDDALKEVASVVSNSDNDHDGAAKLIAKEIL